MTDTLEKKIERKSVGKRCEAKVGVAVQRKLPERAASEVRPKGSMSYAIGPEDKESEFRCLLHAIQSLIDAGWALKIQFSAVKALDSLGISLFQSCADSVRSYTRSFFPGRRILKREFNESHFRDYLERLRNNPLRYCRLKCSLQVCLTPARLYALSPSQRESIWIWTKSGKRKLEKVRRGELESHTSANIVETEILDFPLDRIDEFFPELRPHRCREFSVSPKVAFQFLGYGLLSSDPDVAL